MKTKLFTIFAVAFALATGTVCSAQQEPTCFTPGTPYVIYQEAGVTPDIVQLLSMTQSQVDTANANDYSPLNYWLNQYGEQSEDCQYQIELLQANFGSGQDPDVAGAQIGLLNAQIFRLQLQAEAKEVQTTASLRQNILTPAQNSTIDYLLSQIVPAANTLNLASDANYGDFFPQPAAANPPTTTGGGGGGGGQALQRIVARIRAQRAAAKAEVVAKNRFVK